MVTLGTKHDAIRAMEKGTAQINVAEKMGVPHNTLCMWIKVKEIKKSYEAGIYNLLKLMSINWYYCNKDLLN